MPSTQAKPQGAYLPGTNYRQQIYKDISSWDQMRINIVDFAPNGARFRQIVMFMVKLELVFNVYLIACTLTSRYKSLDCAAHPQRSVELFILAVTLPFFIFKIIALNCCTSPQSVVLQLALFFLIQPLFAAAWEIYALLTVFDLQGCTFTLALFNLFLLLALNLQSLVFAVCVLPYMVCKFCRTVKKQVKEKKRVI